MPNSHSRRTKFLLLSTLRTKLWFCHNGGLCVFEILPCCKKLLFYFLIKCCFLVLSSLFLFSHIIYPDCSFFSLLSSQPCLLLPLSQRSTPSPLFPSRKGRPHRDMSQIMAYQVPTRLGSSYTTSFWDYEIRNSTLTQETNKKFTVIETKYFSLFSKLLLWWLFF